MQVPAYSYAYMKSDMSPMPTCMYADGWTCAMLCDVMQCVCLSANQIHQERIVRFGEDENDIFMLRADDTERARLVEQLKLEPKSPERWLALLKCPPSYEAKPFSRLRLLRRATTILPKNECRHLRSYAELWIMFARLKESEEDARRTFKFMKSERIGENEPIFYASYAAFEWKYDNKLEADEILALGVRNGVFTLRDKEDMYQRLTKGIDPFDELSRSPAQLQTPIHSSRPTRAALASSDLLLTPQTPSFSQTLGYSARKAPNTAESSGLQTPLTGIRSRATAQTTSRKATSLSRLGVSGPPRRVIRAQEEEVDSEEDDFGKRTDPVLESQSLVRRLSPVDELEKASSVGQGGQSDSSNRSTPGGVPDYIKNWEPKPLPLKSSNFADVYRSPKRQQVDSPGDQRAKFDLSPGSTSSVSSTSSPRRSSSDGLSRDPFASLHSRVIVNGRTYMKLEQIGSGGSSKVYRILGPDLKIYALKRIKLKRLDQASIEQYTNEIQLLQRLQGNPHIIRLIAAEKDLEQRTINVLMEHGEIDLGERLRELKDHLDENWLRVIWTQMLEAVHAIHDERIIHGDLKPANFLFVNGALKLIDFGIAKAISNDTTNIERDSQVGTVNYMSPEAIQGNSGASGSRNPQGKMKVGRASDIWSLGCILYQIVYGKPPFADMPRIIEKFQAIIDPAHEIPFPPLNNKALEDVIRRCLQRDHTARPRIDGPDGLLNHEFLRSPSNSNSTPLAITIANAPSVLRAFAGFLRDHHVEAEDVEMFVTVGEQAVRNAKEDLATASPFRVKREVYKYDTQERRTDI